MKTLFLLLATTAAALAQTGDDQRDLGQPLTQADLTALVQKLTIHEMKIFSLQELLRQAEQLRKEVELGGNPQKAQTLLEQVRSQVPKELFDAAMKKALSPESSPSEIRPTPADPRPAESVPPPPRDPSRREPARPNRRPQPPPNLQNNPAVRNLIRLWEKNVGPLEKTPALKKALTEVLQSSMAGGDATSPIIIDDRLNSLLDPDSVLGREMAEWLDQAANGSSWKFSDLGLGDLSLSLPETSLPGGGGNTASGDVGSSISLLTPLLALAALALVVVVLRHYGLIGRTNPIGSEHAARTRPDPGTIQDRESLIAAFEHCSLHTLGDEARAWNHHTIADAITRRLTISDDTAAEASRLYELARYSPPNESLPPESYLQARRCLAMLCEAAPR